MNRRRPAPKPHVYATETVETYESELTKPHFAILMAASGAAGDYRAIAKALSLPLGTVKSRLHRARNLLDALIEGGSHAADGEA